MSAGLDAAGGTVRRALVTGGAGFLGGAIVRDLVAAGVRVTVYSRSASDSALPDGVRAVGASLADREALTAAAREQDVVFHVAAKAGYWGPREEFFATNVEGTRNVLAACLASGVPRLVHTSSPSVCFDGADHVMAGTDLPHAERFLAAYPESKAIAEREVLAANGRPGADGTPLAVCALRPHLIVGPGDPHILPRLVARARAGRLAIVGDGENEVSLTDIDNAAAAHLAAARELAPDAACAGRAYFVAQSEPVRVWHWLNEVFDRVGVPPVRRRVSRRAAYAIGAGCELLWRTLPLRGEPPMTRFVALELSTSHSYDPEPARRDLGYEERWSVAEMTERVVASTAVR